VVVVTTGSTDRLERSKESKREWRVREGGRTYGVDRKDVFVLLGKG
jgi:hypothetical protein